MNNSKRKTIVYYWCCNLKRLQMMSALLNSNFQLDTERRPSYSGGGGRNSGANSTTTHWAQGFSYPPDRDHGCNEEDVGSSSSSNRGMVDQTDLMGISELCAVSQPLYIHSDITCRIIHGVYSSSKQANIDNSGESCQGNDILAVRPFGFRSARENCDDFGEGGTVSAHDV
jgi:hypothetical protein